MDTEQRIEDNMTKRQEAIILLLRFFRNKMSALNIEHKKKIFELMEQFPDISVNELIDTYINVVSRSS